MLLNTDFCVAAAIELDDEMASDKMSGVETAMDGPAPKSDAVDEIRLVVAEKDVLAGVVDVVGAMR